MNRRTFLTALSVLALSPRAAGPSLSSDRITHEERAKRVAAQVSRSLAPREIERVADRVRKSFLLETRGAYIHRDPCLNLSIRNAIETDFQGGRTVSVGGVWMSEIEVGLCILASGIQPRSFSLS